MDRRVYIAGIICLWVFVLFSCFWTVNNLIHGIEFNEFVSFPKLVVIDGINILLFEIIFLLYCHSKNYKIAFGLSFLSTITFTVLYTAVYLFFDYDVGSGYFIDFVLIVHLTAVIIFSLGLVFSKISERSLLKKAGYIGAVIGLVVLSIHVVGLNMQEGATLDVLFYIQMLVGRLGGLTVIFYILIFFQELKSQKNTATLTEAPL